jgi:hypothetical protein
MPGIDPEIHRHLDRLVELGDGPFLHHPDGFAERIEAVAVDALVDLADALSSLGHGLRHHFQAHRPGRAFNHAHRRVDVARVQILQLLLGDRADLIAGDPTGRAAARRPAIPSGGQPPSSESG